MSCIPCQKAAQAIKKAGNIVEGYKNLVITNNVVEELACKRLDICRGCTFTKPLVKVNNVQYYTCSFCSCPIDAKTRSTGEVCPINKW